MSEYQYYEFQAVDRPLTAQEMKELRSYSTRARITPTSFVNDYAWGSFKGNVDVWMEKYFDAFLYRANWGIHALTLRMPSKLLDPVVAKAYCGGDSAIVQEKADRVVLSFVSRNEEGGEWVEGEGQLSSMISVRGELARGDLRALYLGWLLRVQAGELEGSNVEPPVPPGLRELSPSLERLAEFLRIGGDLLDVAASTSRPLGDAVPHRAEVGAWVGRLATEERDEIITNLIVDADTTLIAELVRRYLKEKPTPEDTGSTARRTAGELLGAAESFTEERMRTEAAKRASENARREREAAMAREKRLDSLAGREPELWADIDGLIATRQTRSYNEAVSALVDLRDLYARGTGGDFRMRLEALRQAHARKPAFVERLRKAGL